jgi:superfamily I DNA/RNA helicase
MVDEFQDISKDRWALIESLKANNPNIEFTFVGDDWQAINEFAGSDPEIMISLGNWEKKREQLFLSETFRMPQSLCQYSGEFVMQNSRQIPKELIAKGDTAKYDQSLNFYWDTDPITHVENIKKLSLRLARMPKTPTAICLSSLDTTAVCLNFLKSMAFGRARFLFPPYIGLKD